MAELQDRRLVWDRVFEGVQTGKLAQERNVMQRFFHRRIRVAKPVLHKVNPQHHWQGRRTTATTRLRIDRFNQTFEPRPRHNRVHLRQKLSLTRDLATLR